MMTLGLRPTGDRQEECLVQVREGCLLIASPTLRDPNFARSVVLLCEHGDEGSMGLVLNRPTSHRVAEAIAGMPDCASQTLFWGGPVQQQLVLVLHRSALEAPGGRELVDGMALGNDRDALVQILESNPDPASRVRIFSGYAGWSAGQLAEEMDMHSWIASPAQAAWLFDTEPDCMWSEALRRLGPRYEYMTTMPIDPRVN